MSQTSQGARVLIVGAGPAGIRAAGTLCAAGLRPIVVDEGARAGGQIYRRPPKGFTRSPETLYGSEAAKARALHGAFDALVAADALDYLPRASVVALSDGVAQVLNEGRIRQVPYDRLLLATGAMDRVAPVPGWQSAGVYTLGAAQIALKAQGVALGQQIVLAGSGPLLTLLAYQLRKAGAGLAAVLDTSSLTTQMRGLPGMLARPAVALRGVTMRARLGRLYHSGVTLERIETDATGPVAIHWCDRRGRPRRTPCDMVGLGWHLRAETHLADLAGIVFDYSEVWAQWLPRADAMGRAGQGRYLAGDGLRILGADGAEIAGRLAAIACLQDLGLPAPDPRGELRSRARMERFARGLARGFPWPAQMVRALPDDSIICRCEGITAADLRAGAVLGGAEANRVKSLARVGMGRCQGRYCQLAGAELIAAGAGQSPQAAGRLRGQAPARPVPAGAYCDETGQ
ncbi:FAD/NAD(P)-dependent oxidoreductase [Pseudodonghicola xiamenensis]|uniref:FAD/NAD(P)-binding oxidoreductase n=1 Tax=Pseudodonghicola xiamenensis TaxID=337702 RepID=A0A8J3H7E8_9RHOB|nr:FAD/NAD(P)-binding oxidoreductase [Pseudodonghicola xiamenensis]GHG96148.1 FAD/NAD(P)-binding oxidoreductase [Pseudodonghicola xiamenensis]